jgi:hypothetical protein
MVQLSSRLRLTGPGRSRITAGRKRAREIWAENSRPVGRDVEFWLQAEREFREAEELAKKLATTSNRE